MFAFEGRRITSSLRSWETACEKVKVRPAFFMTCIAAANRSMRDAGLPQSLRMGIMQQVAAGASHSTVNSHFASIRVALKLEGIQTPSRVGKILHIPIVRVENTRQGFLEYDDHISILDALAPSLNTLFVIAFHSGCRLGEVLNMKWSDVDWKNEVIRLPKTKNGTQRNLPFWGPLKNI